MTTTQAIIERLRAGITLHLGDDVCADAGVLDDAADEIERVAAVNADLLAACKKQHEALDMLFAMLIARSPPGDTFHPSKSGPPWEAMLAGNAAIAKATGEAG